jgi:hypothetical protein
MASGVPSGAIPAVCAAVLHSTHANTTAAKPRCSLLAMKLCWIGQEPPKAPRRHVNCSGGGVSIGIQDDMVAEHVKFLFIPSIHTTGRRTSELLRI